MCFWQKLYIRISMGCMRTIRCSDNTNEVIKFRFTTPNNIAEESFWRYYIKCVSLYVKLSADTFCLWWMWIFDLRLNSSYSCDNHSTWWNAMNENVNNFCRFTEAYTRWLWLLLLLSSFEIYLCYKVEIRFIWYTLFGISSRKRIAYNDSRWMGI